MSTKGIAQCYALIINKQINMNNKRAKKIARAVKSEAKEKGVTATPNMIRKAKKEYLLRGGILKQEPKLKTSKRQARLRAKLEGIV